MAASKDTDQQRKLKDFVRWFTEHCKGDEKGEGQIFFERLLIAFGNAGVHEAGAVCEERIKRKNKGTGFADLVWKPRVIIELKKRGEPLHKHYDQAFEYWLQLVPNRPQYMALCNFDEFWIYDLNTQLNDPVHKLKTTDLANDWGGLAFLFPTPQKPVFTNNNVEVTEKAAGIVGSIYLSLIQRKVPAEQAQRFVLQLVVALFAEDVGLIPKYTLHRILIEAVKKPVAQRELQELFEAMSTDKPSKKTSKYKSISYFNGGLFHEVDPVELTFKEIDSLAEASKEDWSKVRPSIFGAIFESSMDPKKRHGHGVHFTNELDIQKIVTPTIVRPFRVRIEKAKSKAALQKILNEVQHFKVLDPACGSGNFLYVAFRELRRIENDLYERIGKGSKQSSLSLITPRNFYGIDTNKFAIELAKVALSIGRKLAADEFSVPDNVLPFEDLDGNFKNEDSLFTEWPRVDTVIGNPPFLSSKFLKVEYEPSYVDRVRKKFSGVPGRADYCVYWFRKAHDHLKTGQRAGLVGTNTIRQNYSREGGLDYIASTGGTITEAVSSQVWSGEANVHVSIVNWAKGNVPGKKRLFTQKGDKKDSPWDVVEVDTIEPSLSAEVHLGGASTLKANRTPKVCFVGQAPQSEGFYLSKEETNQLVRKDPASKQVVWPFLIGRELLSKERSPSRFVIDFSQKDMLAARAFKEAFKHVENTVYPDVQAKAAKEVARSGEEGDWSAHLKHWWWHWRGRSDLISSISKLSRYIVVSRVTKRPIFEFASPKIHPGDALVAFTFEDDYSFGVITSEFHSSWFREKCSTLKGDMRYTGDTVWDTFPWPQNPSDKQVLAVAKAARELREFRLETMNANEWGLKDLYRSLDSVGKNPLRDQHEALDAAVRSAYGMKQDEDLLVFLLNLNSALSKKEDNGEKIQGPGIPQNFKTPKNLVSSDCIEP